MRRSTCGAFSTTGSRTSPSSPKSEIWPNLILESSARDIPLALVNARMTKRSFRRWRRRPGMARPLFSRFSLVLTQNDPLTRRFKALGAAGATAVGNLKIDTPPPPVNAIELQRLKPALEGRALLVAASTHEGEDAIVAEAHRQLRQSLPDLCTIIAPRHPERGAAIADLLKSQGLSVARRSLGALPERTSDAYVADTIGELGMLYKLAPVAFIGGSLVDRGGQNPIEAVRQGAAVITGPHLAELRRHLSRADRPSAPPSSCAPRRNLPAPPAACLPTAPS